ncbi:uncharacterized protein RHIMIDRAFT_121264 [Rhizopus microsporus ATCC 52813]|uniref:Uncharacterized protein n=1 Tax=Rhizopus microsporus ATCC 52813 TaxID=1340429 RepID=A0A2G4SXQ9_RHIZD|nr:uncharacterized protein RHIMIDRAFT_121264 [Rhizopus microsporus ATCC 52813]PHZ13534.1 hypothetical protein RHIMIDRAFT_121264 [Rhizopus microsporus ATCC 52813]
MTVIRFLKMIGPFFFLLLSFLLFPFFFFFIPFKMTLLSFLLLFPLFILHSVHCGAFISSNPVILYSNGTISQWNTAYIKAEEFKSIITFDNLVQPPSAGLEV